MWINRIVGIGLQITHINFPSILCIVHSDRVVCIFLSWHYWSLFLWESGVGVTITVNAHRYKVTLEPFRRSELSPHQLDVLWFQLDGATAHTAQTSRQVLRTAFPDTHFSFWGHHLPRPLAWSCSTRLLPLGLRQKQGIRNISCQYWWFKTANSGVYSRDLSGNATAGYDKLSMATAGVYWTSWWSFTKCHIKTLMISMNYHGHILYLLVLIIFFSTLPYVTSFQKPSAIFGSSCVCYNYKRLL